MRSKSLLGSRWLAVVVAAALLAGTAEAVRIKDLGRVSGPTENPLIGYGLVVGLNGTGDDAKFAPSIKLLSNMLTQMGASNLPIEVRGTKNVAVVEVSGTLPAFSASVGDRFDVKVSAVGNAKSLAGGHLVVCPLSALGLVYASASGDVRVDQQNLTGGTIEQGGIVQEEVPVELLPGGKLTFKLLPQNADYSVATRIVEAIHQDMNIDIAKGDAPVARAVDAATIEVTLTQSQAENPVAFISRLERLSVPGLDYDMEAKVFIDEKAGTYSWNGNVEISPVFVQHANMQIQIRPTQGEEATTLQDMVQALKDLNATPSDVIGIIKALEAQGALHAKVIRK